MGGKRDEILEKEMRTRPAILDVGERREYRQVR